MARSKEAIKQFDFIRAVACIGIVLYHFSVESGWFNIIRVISGGGDRNNMGGYICHSLFCYIRCIAALQQCCNSECKKLLQKKTRNVTSSLLYCMGIDVYSIGCKKQKRVL